MSQKWPYDGIEALSKCARLDMARNIARYPWFGIHNNVNIPFCIYQQHLDNQSHFDSGTAGTIIVINDRACIPPNFTDLKLSLVKGYKNHITCCDILELDLNTSQRLDTLAIYTVLTFLIDAPEFGFDSYRHKNSTIFK
jgi:hypothetical protein